MVSTAVMREAWKEYLCIADHQQRRPVMILGRNAGWCPPEMLEPFEALSQALANNGYRDAFDIWVPRKCAVGINGKRCRPDGTDCSLHNYGVAVDIDAPTPSNKVVRNGSANPFYGDTGHWKFGDIKLTEAQVKAVEGIRTTGGHQLFQWLGSSRINDTMHFEVQVPPSKTEVEWGTVQGGRREVPVVARVGEGLAATYIVQNGDTIVKIAGKFEIPTAKLVAANPQIPNPSKIFPGQVLIIPRIN